MTILVTGSTGRIGAQVVDQLARSGRAVRALTRSPGKSSFPPGVLAVKGDLLDADAMRAAACTPMCRISRRNMPSSA